jgi:NitT/TauT family transport system ATP-binding protein
VTILGPSGCGKSTLLRLVAGLDRPTTGRIILNGKPVIGPGPDRGMVFQSYTLFPWLTVADNVAFGLREKGAPAARRAAVVSEWIERVGLVGFEHHYPKQLSGGMQQRTAIARALANDPAILLLDEPFGALDNQTRALMQELVLGIWERERKTVLFVTHDIEEAIFLASRVVVMTARPGRIKAEVLIELPHPRHYTIKTSAEFSTLKARLTEDSAPKQCWQPNACRMGRPPAQAGRPIDSGPIVMGFSRPAPGSTQIYGVKARLGSFRPCACAQAIASS